ncbi:MAG: 4-hydroxy-tetrahydrodipicolinate synthase [Clostridiaceae bacterium]|nr:4-hydroxy-tetrahydrodipicolinate synthase [Clostridiaceae bacterium]
MRIDGVWLPIITPFLEDKVDFKSYKKMIEHYISKGVTGIIPLGTTGESPTVGEDEFEEIIEKTMEYVHGRVPVIVGAGGNNTKKVQEKLKIVEKYKVNGVLSVSPYYNRPDQRGIYEHFLKLSETTDLDIIIYNIPYRTGRNIENETLFKLSELKNIIGVKDASGDIKQSLSLLLNVPPDFSIMTGEDIFFYITLVYGGQGGILASSHVETESFIEVYNRVRKNDHQGAFEVWKKLAKIIPLLFEEPNPSPIKYCLKKMGLIESPELRLPLVTISEKLQKKLDNYI